MGSGLEYPWGGHAALRGLGENMKNGNNLAGDETLYHQYLCGDDTGLDALMKRYGDPLTLYIDGNLHDIHEAEELMIDVFADLFTKKPKIRDGGFKAYLYKAARHMALRRKSRRRFCLSLDELAAAPDARPLTEEVVRTAERNRVLHACMGDMNPDYREALYLTYFDSVQKGENFFAEYADCFKESDDKKLIDSLNQKYGLSIDYTEFMRSYAVISNVSIDENWFLNLDVKNNIDLARWAENAYETQWGYVPHSDGNVLYADLYQSLQEQYPDEITEECDKWRSRRAVDNYNLLRSYLWYDAESREITVEGYSETVQELYQSASVKGSMDTLPKTVGTVVICDNIIGIFVGDSYVVYAKSIAEGVVKESVSEGNWTAWFEIPWIQYGEEKSFSNDIQFEEYDPAVKNNLDLVQWAIQAHENGWGYVYGTYGNVLTESLLQDRASVFGGQVTSYMDFIRSNWMGKRTSDCVGLIKGYGWYDSVSGEIVVGSNGMMDVTANGMFDAATVKGTIDTIPEVPGLAVWHQGHIGIYIGNGEVVEAMNTTRGVTRTKLAGRSWTHWLQIPYISYVEEKENESTLEK